MKKILSKPHVFFFALIPVVLAIGFLYREEAIELHISYAPIRLSYSDLSYFFIVFFGLVGLNYYSLHWAQKKSFKWMTGTHIVLQIISLLLLYTKDNWNWLAKHDYPSELNFTIDYSNLILILSILVFIISAFIHLINFFVSLISKSK